MKIATWNVNSLKVRLPHVQAWLADINPDVLVLQEIKMPTDAFPLNVFADMGYQSIASGQRTYNGMAIIARHDMKDMVTDIPNLEDPQRRLLAVTINDIRIFNLYVPNGESLTSDKYLYKLNWLSNLDAYIKQQVKQYPKTLLLGDFNIAPADIDVHKPERWKDSVLCSESERAAFHSLINIGFKDCYRELAPEEVGYSWWDYRMNSFRRNNGLRIDHILASDALFPACKRCYIDKEPRAWERPSDHAPVVLELT